MRPQKLIRLGIQTALISILFSSILFFAYYFTSYNFIVYLEYIFIFIIGAVSFILLLRIINHITKHKRSRKSLILISLVIVSSMIVSLIYFRYFTRLLDTMRINFVNQSSYALTDLKITGCQKKSIGNIPPKSSAIVWIKIGRPCAISISYRENGVNKNEVITQYVSPSEGQKINFKIGENK